MMRAVGRSGSKGLRPPPWWAAEAAMFARRRCKWLQVMRRGADDGAMQVCLCRLLGISSLHRRKAGTSKVTAAASTVAYRTGRWSVLCNIGLRAMQLRQLECAWPARLQRYRVISFGRVRTVL